jgi:pantoate--beta-alanine ligase
MKNPLALREKGGLALKMQIVTNILEMQSLAESLRRQGSSIGFVPTMGFLHEGHLSLMRQARQACNTAVVSIFVNPTQFGPNEDFQRYPRDEEGDRKKCEAASVDVLFMPLASDMYAEPGAFVTVEGISEILEGKVRPGHFRGVATVVNKLFNIVKPHKAFFGQKDFQQCVVIKRMVKGLNLDVEIIILPTVREQDGLAMSSRNSYLNADERRAAPVIFQALSAARELFLAGAREPEKIKNVIRAVLQGEPGVKIDYVEVADPENLAPLETPRDTVAILVAVRLGRTRLIDNIVIL